MLDKDQLNASIRQTVAQALHEDIGDGDISANLVAQRTRYAARVITREPAVIAGSAWVNETFRQVDSTTIINWMISDGQQVEPGQELFQDSGSARSLLTAERTALNFLQLLSGTATSSAEFAKQVAGTKAKILDTRKTLPGLRLAQKYAVSCGGCFNHRIGLYDAYLIKENHVLACGSIINAIELARRNHSDKPVEVEVENLTELSEALAAKADIIMLDNFSINDMCKAVAENAGRAKLEASGNISLEQIKSVAETGVDYISIGALTKHVRAIDLSMRFNC